MTISYDNRARLFWILIAFSMISFFVYIYAIKATAQNTVARQNLERQVTEVSTKLDSLEFTYIKLKNNVTAELASQYGFREVKNPLYVSRTSARSSLSFNTLNQ